MIPFYVIGGGRRAEFFLRIARALPAEFRVAGLLVRDAAKAAALHRAWAVPVHTSLDALLSVGPADFAVLAVTRTAAPDFIRELAARKIPVLCETPPAPDVAGLQAVHALVRRGARVQVAEQYHAQPWHAARLALVQSGRLGRVHHAQVAVAHGYHGVSLIRRLLGAGFAEATISARQFTAPSTDPARPGEARHTIATLDFGDRSAVFDFSSDQYFSPLRAPRVLVRGDRGELNDTTLRGLNATGEPVTLELARVATGTDGNPQGYALHGITVGDEWVYRNPYRAALGDDELAGAACLTGMARYVGGGPDFYSLAEAAQDHALALLIDEAAASRRELRSTPQPWATA